MNNETIATSTPPVAVVTEVKALDIQPGNMVILRLEAHTVPDSITKLVQTVRDVIPQNCTIGVLIGDNDLTVLTDESMRANGWVRAALLEELIPQVEQMENRLRLDAEQTSDNDDGDFERIGILYHADVLAKMIVRAKGTQPELPL